MRPSQRTRQPPSLVHTHTVEMSAFWGAFRPFERLGFQQFVGLKSSPFDYFKGSVTRHLGEREKAGANNLGRR